MKKNAYTAAILIFALILSVLSNGIKDISASSKIALTKKKVTIKVGKSIKLGLKNIRKSTEKKVSWKSSKKSVATVSKKGKVKAKKAGKAKISATLWDKTYTCKVTVKSAKKKTINTQKPSTTPTQTPQIVYVEVTDAPVRTETPKKEGNLTYQSDVTQVMTKASYWADKDEGADILLLDDKMIEEQNKLILNDPSANMYDLKGMSSIYDATSRKESLARALISDVMDKKIGSKDTIYKDGVAIGRDEIDEWFHLMEDNIIDAATSDTARVRYAICTKRADQFIAPTDAYVGWKITDPYNRFIKSSININEPFVIEAQTSDGMYYWGRSTYSTGWVRADHFAICDDKKAWEDQWNPDDLLVITTDHITLNELDKTSYASESELTLGTRLPLVPKDYIDSESVKKDLKNMGTWYNYVVYMPTRGSDGKLIKKAALIGMHHEVSAGYLELTRRNILKIAFSCLGSYYGQWNLSDESDGSVYINAIYRCFGLELPKNSAYQKDMSVSKVDLSSMSDPDKKNAISELDPGTLLAFSGHIAMYLGETDGKQYVISDQKSLSKINDTADDVPDKSICGISINSVDDTAQSGSTWADKFSTALYPWIVTKSYGFDSGWKYASNSKINTGSSTLYRAPKEIAKKITVALDAGHGTKGGMDVYTLCHPDGSPKVIKGSKDISVKEVEAVSDGEIMTDGTTEATVVLRYANILKKRLLDSGYDVLMIRDADDVALDNVARALMANAYANCHISLHYDYTDTDEGVFYCSVPDDESYKNMEPVKTWWEKHTELGESIIMGFKLIGANIRTFGSGSEGALPMDLTQTSYSTIPSIDLELGDRASDFSDKTLKRNADGVLNGLEIFFAER